MRNAWQPSTTREKILWLKANTIQRGECWEWQSAIHGVGYGCVPQKIHKSRYAHRAMFDFAVAPIPHGLYVLHECDNRICINPAHLWLGTHLDNVKDMQAKNRHSGGSMPNELNPWCKFSDATVAAIRRAAASGIAKRYIERDFKISESHYYRITKGISRKGISL